MFGHTSFSEAPFADTDPMTGGGLTAVGAATAAFSGSSRATGAIVSENLATASWAAEGPWQGAFSMVGTVVAAFVEITGGSAAAFSTVAMGSFIGQASQVISAAFNVASMGTLRGSSNSRPPRNNRKVSVEAEDRIANVEATTRVAQVPLEPSSEVDA